ncbi:hypothetical protein HY484_03750 [Candidatus Woesearchaeota archaeon]|nr:hypothetical protein [Candidatus Woesearchaeota archaeon]
MESTVKERYGFEGDSYYVAQILKGRLKEFLPRSEMKDFCSEILRIALLELNLCSNKSPKKILVENTARSLLEYCLPVIYSNILDDFRKKERTYVDVDDGQLESFVHVDDDSYHLTGVVKIIEDEVRSRHKK